MNLPVASIVPTLSGVADHIPDGAVGLERPVSAKCSRAGQHAVTSGAVDNMLKRERGIRGPELCERPDFLPLESSHVH